MTQHTDGAAPAAPRRKRQARRAFRGEMHGSNLWPMRRWKSPSRSGRMLGLAEPYDYHARGFGFRVLTSRQLESVV